MCVSMSFISYQLSGSGSNVGVGAVAVPKIDCKTGVVIFTEPPTGKE